MRLVNLTQQDIQLLTPEGEVVVLKSATRSEVPKKEDGTLECTVGRGNDRHDFNMPITTCSILACLREPKKGYRYIVDEDVLINMNPERSDLLYPVFENVAGKVYCTKFLNTSAVRN